MGMRLAGAVGGVVLAVASTACRTASPVVDVWVLDSSGSPPSTSLEGTETGPASLGAQGLRGPGFTGAASAGHGPSRVKLAGAVNETVSFRFAVRGGAAPIPQPRFRVDRFQSASSWIDAAVVELYRMHAVAVGRFPGWHIRSIAPRDRDQRPLDALVPIRAPRGGLPSVLPAGVTYHFWADVAIPKGTSEGTYAGRIEVLSDDKPVATIHVELTVWPMMLPDTADLAAIVELDHRALLRHHLEAGSGIPAAVDDWGDHPRRSELEALLRSTMRMLQAHRLTPVLPELEPTVKLDASGGLATDWAQYDEVVEPLLSGRAFFNRVPLSVWPLPIHRLFTAGRSSGGSSSPASDRLSRAYLSECVAHFAERGWLDRAWALPPRTTGWGVEAVETTRRFAALARSGAGRVPIASPSAPSASTAASPDRRTTCCR